MAPVPGPPLVAVPGVFQNIYVPLPQGLLPAPSPPPGRPLAPGAGLPLRSLAHTDFFPGFHREFWLDP